MKHYTRFNLQPFNHSTVPEKRVGTFMSNTVSVDDQEFNSSQPHFDSAVQDTESTALGSAAGKKIRAAVARQPGLATLLAVITGALAMTVLRNRATKRTAFSSSENPRRRQTSTKKAS